MADRTSKTLAFRKGPLEWRAVVQIVTVAKFRRPRTPKTCNTHAYHVWGWWARPDDPNRQPIDGMKCECCCLTWKLRPDVTEQADARS